MCLRIPAISFVLLLFLAVNAHAQAPGRVSGRVLDQTGAALPGVAIDLVVNSRELTAVTDDTGAYRFDAVPSGSAELTFRLLNFSVLRRSVSVANGASVNADVVLTLSLSADVIVTGTGTFRNVADVEDPAANLVGIAASASQGAVTAAQLDERPIMRAGEVLETVPGLVVSQHSGEGKANQYYLRGFNLDHGTDFSTTVAGVPVNTPTGAHAHGYSDVSFLIPELVSGVQFKKGPYFADEGDFSAAGAANVNYVNQLDRPIVRVSAGNDGWGRLFGAASPRVGGGYLLGALEVNHNDGPWVQPDDYRKINGVLRYSRGDNRNGFSLTGMGYWADWDSTDQVPERAINEGLIPRFGLIDASDGGKANRQSLAAEYQRSNGPSSLRATGFVLHNSLNLFSNFTYFLDDPDNGDQFEQAERRVAAGGRVTYRRLGHFFERHTESAIGVQLRRDWLDPVGLYRTAGRQRLSTTREDEVGQTMAAVYAQSEIEWTRTFSHDVRAPCGSVSVFGHVGQPAEFWRWLRWVGQSQSGRDLRTMEGDRGLRERRHRLPQQRCTRRHHRRGSREWRSGRSRDAARSGEGCGDRAANGPHPRSAVDRCAVVLWVSIQSCCLSATPERQNRVARAVASGSNGRTTHGWRRG